MAATPKYKIFMPDGEYVASCKYAEDAAALVAIFAAGATIRLSHKAKDTVWTEGETGDAAESYDNVARHIHDLEAKLYAAGRTRLL